MVRQKIRNVLLVASLSAIATVAAGQQTGGQQNNTPRNAPVGTTPAPAVGTQPAAGSTPSSTQSTSGAMGTSGSGTTGSAMDSGAPRDMTGYKAARSACDSGPPANKSKCITTLNTRYSNVDSKCSKLSASALDDCLKGADHGQ